MVQMILSAVCSAECDLRASPSTLSHQEAIEAWNLGRPIECVECLCGYSTICLGRSFQWHDSKMWVRWPNLKWAALGYGGNTISQASWEQYLLDFGNRHRWRVIER